MRETINKIDAVIYTHDHADHVNGIDDLRYATIKQRIMGSEGYKMPIYGDADTLEAINTRFYYMFQESLDGLYVPMLEVNVVKTDSTVTIGELEIKLFNQIHGINRSLGIRVGDVAYSTDVSDLDDKAFGALAGIKTWIVDCGQFGSDTTTVHANFDKVMSWNARVGAEKLYLTHLTPRIDYNETNKATPEYVECAYDGLRIAF